MRIVFGLFLPATTLAFSTLKSVPHHSTFCEFCKCKRENGQHTNFYAILSLENTNMPPRRAKKPVDPQPSSSDSEPEVPSQSLASKVKSKLKSIVGLETNGANPAAATKKRKRTRAVAEHQEEDEEDEEPTRKRGSPRKPRAVPQRKTDAPRKSPAQRARVSATKARVTKTSSESSESEDELAVAPVSPVKPRTKGKAKAAPVTPQKSATNRARKPVTNTRQSGTAHSRKTRKAKDEYDSSIRELSHDSDSPTPSESSDTRGSVDYDPEAEEAKSNQDDDEAEEEDALETMEVDSDALDDESDFGPHKIAERASASPTKKHVTAPSKAGRKSVVAKSSRKSVGKRAKKEETSEEEYQSDESGPIVVGKVVQAPQSGRGRAGNCLYWSTLWLTTNEPNSSAWADLPEHIRFLAQPSGS